MQLTQFRAIADAFRRLRGLSLALSGTLALLLLTHIIMCPPTLDDDVCAAARIDHAVQCTLDKTTHVARPDGDLPTLAVPEPAQQLVAFFAAIFTLPQPVETPFFPGLRVQDRSSALAHKRTVVLLT